jgi:hypothetical protein
VCRRCASASTFEQKRRASSTSPKSRQRLVARVEAREAALHELLRAHLDVETKLIVDVSLMRSADRNGSAIYRRSFLKSDIGVIGCGTTTPPTELGEKFARRGSAVNTRVVNYL